MREDERAAVELHGIGPVSVRQQITERSPISVVVNFQRAGDCNTGTTYIRISSSVKLSCRVADVERRAGIDRDASARGSPRADKFESTTRNRKIAGERACSAERHCAVPGFRESP